jgi:heme exporter protein B
LNRTGPGFLRAAGTLAAKDLRVEWRSLDALSSMLLFSLIVLLVFSFAFDLSTLRELGAARLLPGVLWTTFAFTGIVAFARSFESERLHGSLTGLRIAPVDGGALFAGKTLANLVTLATLQALLLPLSALWFDYDLGRVLGPLALVVTLHTVGLAELGTLFSAVAVRLGRGEALLATLLLPASSPLLISAVKCTAVALAGEDLGRVRHWLLVAVGFDVLYFLVAWLTFEYVLED